MPRRETSALNTDRRTLMFGAAALAAFSAASAHAQSPQPAAGAPPSAGGGAERASQIGRALLDGPPVPAPAMSFAVADAGGVLWAEAFGKADLELDIDATPAHRFRLQSVSKVVTATLAARLASKGVIDLDAPISTWLPDLPEQHRRTTLSQLLTHRGGIRHYIERDFLAPDKGSIDFRIYPTNAEILDIFIDDPLVGAPGEQVSYSTFGYTLASIAMEAAAGQAFPELVKSEIGAGFDLPSLDTDTPQELRPMRVEGYNDDFARFLLMGGPPPSMGVSGEWTNARQATSAYKWAGGGLLMSPSDLARFGAAHLESASKITSEERMQLFSPVTEATENSPPLGLGWRVDSDAKGRKRWHHAGSSEGGRAGLVVYPDLGLSIALASNVMSTPGDVLMPSSNLADAFA